jgi:hypothetical protein
MGNASGTRKPPIRHQRGPEQRSSPEPTVPEPSVTPPAEAPLSADLPEGLFAHYPLQGNLNDAGPYGKPLTQRELRTGRVLNGISFVAEDEGGGVAFDGLNYLHLDALGKPDFGTGPYTIAFWLWLGAPVTEEHATPPPVLFCLARDTGNYDRELVVVPYRGRLSAWDHQGGRFGFEGGELTGTTHLPLQQWVHVALARGEDGVTSLYVDGQLEAAREPHFQIAYVNRCLVFGGDYRDHGLGILQRKGLVGRMRDIRVYSLALDAWGVLDLVDGGLSRVRAANKMG